MRSSSAAPGITPTTQNGRRPRGRQRSRSVSSCHQAGQCRVGSRDRRGITNPASLVVATSAWNPVTRSIRWQPGPGWLPVRAGKKLRKSADFSATAGEDLATSISGLALGRSGAPAPGIRNGARRNHVFCGLASRPLRYRLSPFVPCSEVSKVSEAFRRSVVADPTRGATITRVPHSIRAPAGATSPSSDRVRDVSFTRQHDILSREHLLLRSRRTIGRRQADDARRGLNPSPPCASPSSRRRVPRPSAQGSP